MNLIKKSMKIAHKMNVIEITFFKIYLVIVALLLAIWFPVIISANLGVYIVIFIISLIFSLSSLTKQKGNFYKTIFKKGLNTHIFSKMSMFDLSMFKTTVFTGGLILAKLFPSLLNINTTWYVVFAGIYIEYFILGLFKKK